MSDKAYTVRCAGRAVRTYRTLEEAEAMKAAIEDEPGLFLEIQEWEPEQWYPYVAFDDDQDKE